LVRLLARPSIDWGDQLSIGVLTRVALLRLGSREVMIALGDKCRVSFLSQHQGVSRLFGSTIPSLHVCKKRFGCGEMGPLTSLRETIE
jgi:hypothetical protein